MVPLSLNRSKGSKAAFKQVLLFGWAKQAARVYSSYLNCKGPQTNMPQNVGSIKDLTGKNKHWVDALNCAKLIVLRENELCKTSTRQGGHQKQSGGLAHKNGETAVYGYHPALFLVLSVSCSCLAKLIFTECDQLCRFQRVYLGYYYDLSSRYFTEMTSLVTLETTGVHRAFLRFCSRHNKQWAQVSSELKYLWCKADT